MKVKAKIVFVDMDGILRKKEDSFQIADDKAKILIESGVAVKDEFEPVPKARQTRAKKPKTID